VPEPKADHVAIQIKAFGRSAPAAALMGGLGLSINGS